mgnify:CR=1 FL=1
MEKLEQLTPTEGQSDHNDRFFKVLREQYDIKLQEAREENVKEIQDLKLEVEELK